MKRLWLFAAALLACPVLAHADAVTDWNLKAAEITIAGRLAPHDSWTVMATTNVAASDALSAISGQSPFIAKLDKTSDAAPEAGYRRGQSNCAADDDSQPKGGDRPNL